jgi:1-aminocyclopropane-1-carboxylate deaminase
MSMTEISRNQLIRLPIVKSASVELWVKREDELHPLISGNKFRKLKYNIEEARQQRAHTLLTFGGAFSNHILATAAAAAEYGFKSVGIIRGEELASTVSSNATLSKAAKLGMKFVFVSRDRYRELTADPKKARSLSEKGGQYLIPEGGSNSLAVKGVSELFIDEDVRADYICSPVGTGATLAGIVEGAHPTQKVRGYASLSHERLNDEVKRFTTKDSFEIIDNYTFGGYAKTTPELISRMNWFYKQTKILLDPVYTGKMIFGLLEDIRRGAFEKGSVILAIHTGGLQGIEGMNARLERKGELKITV